MPCCIDGMERFTPPRRILDPSAAQMGLVRWRRDPQVEHLSRLIDQALATPIEASPVSGERPLVSLRTVFSAAS
jgi:hypothetical protein